MSQNPRSAYYTPEQLRRMPYQFDQPADILSDLVVAPAVPDDERIWVPQAENVWFRPLCLNRSAGYWMNLLRVRKSGVLSRHRHPGPVHAFVIKDLISIVNDYIHDEITVLVPTRAGFYKNVHILK